MRCMKLSVYGANNGLGFGFAYWGKGEGALNLTFSPIARRKSFHIENAKQLIKCAYSGNLNNVIIFVGVTKLAQPAFQDL